MPFPEPWTRPLCAGTRTGRATGEQAGHMTRAQTPVTTPAPGDPESPGLDAADLAVFLRVVDELIALPHDHPHQAVARRATSSLFKAVKKQRRTEKREVISAAGDRLVRVVVGE